MTYKNCIKCNAMLTERFIQMRGPKCPDCHATLGQKLYRAFRR